MSAPVADASLLGALLAGRYEIRALLGRGGMGEVFEAVDRSLGRTVAVKVIRTELAADRRFLARFRREARTAAGLAHPGIVAVHDVGEDAGRTFIVMEFVAGRTLAELSDDGPLGVDTVARVGGAAARALAHAHERGVVHRDVSAANVMMTFDGGVKVLDFGIARGGSARVGARATHGTLAYLAPEVLRGEPVDARADIFALGAVLRELTLKASGRTSGLDAAIARATAERPNDRFPSASAMAEAFERAAAQLTPSSPGRAPVIGDDMRTPERTAPIPHRPARPLPVRGATPAGLRPVRGVAVVGTRPRPRRGWVARTLVMVAIAGIVAGGALVIASTLASLSSPQSTTSVRGPAPVPVPEGLTASASCDGLFSTGVDLAWTGKAPVKGYEVWRRGIADDSRTLVVRLRGVHSTSYRDVDLGVDTRYTYRVRAFDGPLVSDWSEAAKVSTPLLCLT